MVSRTLVTAITISISAQAAEFNDPLFERQWNIHNDGQSIQRDSGEMTQETIHGLPGMDIHWMSMENFSIPQDRQILVAFLDSGVDVHHPELKDRILPSQERCFFKGKKKGFGDVCYGYNALQDNADISDGSGHGTHTVGIIAAEKNNHEGIVGIADHRIKILPIKVIGSEINSKSFSYKGKLITEYIARGVEYALEQKADLINISLGWPELANTQAIQNAFQKAFNRGVPIIAAAGNNNKQIPVYPCISPHVICVGAVDVQGQLTEFSNFGGKVDILAPGEQILSTFPQGEDGMDSPLLQIRGYERKSGTSQAAPAITAVVASLKLIDPALSIDEIKARLYANTYLPTSSDKAKKFTKYGIVNMANTLTKRPNTLLDIDYKQILEIPFDFSSGQFSFTLPIRSLLRDENQVIFHITQDNPSLRIDNPRGTIDLPVGETIHLSVTGTVLDLTGESRSQIKIHLRTQENHFTTQTTIFLAQQLNEKQKYPLRDSNPTELIKETQGKRFTTLKPVADTERWKQSTSYFISRPGKLILWEPSHNIFAQRQINIPGLEKIGAVFRNDLDFDGKPDIFVYGVDKKRRQIFVWLNENGTPLISCTLNGQVPFPSGAIFGFLPLKYRFQENFSWIKQKTSCGTFKVPVIQRKQTLPPEDDSDDITEQSDDGARDFYNYVLTLSPSGQKMEIKPRVIDTLQLKNRLRRQYGFLPVDPVTFTSPFSQSVEDQRMGKIDGMASLGTGFDRISISWRLAQYGEEVKTKIIENVYHNPRAYKITPLRTLAQPFAGTPSTGNSLILPEHPNTLEVFAKNMRSTFVSNSWNDVIFDVLAGFQDRQTTTLFMEGRYHIYAFDPMSGWNKHLRINRDSTLPGSALTETIAPIHVVTDTNKILPGLQINNTLVYGRRLYVMLRRGKRFYRPLKLSIAIPPHCIPLFPGRHKNMLSHTLLCHEKNSNPYLLLAPLALTH